MADLPQDAELIVLGKHGVAYRPKFFTEDIFDIDKAFELFPTNDDFWFTGHLWANKVPIRFVFGSRFDFGELDTPHSLWDGNKNRNDEYVPRIYDHFV